MKFGKTAIEREELYAVIKPIKNWYVNVDNIVISKLAKTKTNCKYLIGYLDKDIRPLVLVMPKMSEHIKLFEIEDKDNKLMSFRIDGDKLFEKYKAISTKIEDLKNIELNDLPVYDDRYIKTKVGTYSYKVYTNFLGLNVPEKDIECQSFTVTSIDSLLVYDNKYYL